MSELCWTGAGELARMMRAGEVSAREVVTAHLRQIEQVNPAVNAVVTLVAERALDEAEEADRRWASRSERDGLGPLHGLPIAHKDTHDTAGIRTTYGSPLLSDNVPVTDELVVERLRGAGAITIGKTNVPVFAAGSHTVNPIFGATRNPYNLDRSAGGSSGGAAAALASGMHPLADGSDFGGSLRNPASFCNVVGLRPSPGRVATWPDLLPWSPLAVQGPMGRTVADVALGLSVLAGPDPRAPAALEHPGPELAQLGQPGQPAPDLTGLRVAWAPDLGGRVVVDPEVTAALAPAAEVFTGLGARVEPACPDLTGADDVFRTLRAWRFAMTYGALAEAQPDGFSPQLLDNIDEGRRVSGADLARAEAAHTALYHRVRKFFTAYDLLLAPVSQVPAFPIEWRYPTEVAGQPMQTYLDWMASAYLISTTGCPALSVPGGFTPDGLPVGLQIVGPHRGDLAVLRAGHAFEQVTRHAAVRPPVVAAAS
ncbi:MAG TPA: amidase [Sporichthyaceae bacterium]|nr:amidase [Sporichthyaceae bacterium]